MKTNYSVLAVFFIASLCALPGSAAGGADADALFARTPADTEVMIHINSLEKFYDHLRITGNSIMGKPLGKIDGISKSLGFNPFSIPEGWPVFLSMASGSAKTKRSKGST